ncbi:dehydratase [Ciceribacter ferrooxidans]|uniref:Dehydratase n=1 Tax=Ciceribacter ferrooxidans TaxID=2509717 RepID=A0A4Q2T9H8_9HYPH|nr:dehydratase [Ciceribacter ferrooxidans]RYC15577.1 dehydratase [Ciceribacter ferrooxidans]
MTDDAQAVKLYPDDLEAGQRFTSPSHVMELDEIREFAGRYDPQFFHLDDELARDSLPLAGGLIGAGGEISWPRATWPGDRIHVESEIVTIAQSRSKPERGLVTFRSETLNQDGEIVQVFTPKIVSWRRPVIELRKNA